MQTRAIMICGTGSDVGKSLIVAGLARVFHRRGLRVRPFKPQNMSNNAAVTVDGGEIGRAQALQARASGVAPSVDMNPVLLKPQSEVGSQVVVRGKVLGSYRAKDYQELKPALMRETLSSFGRLMSVSDLVLVEGAGSPAEINLRKNDLANMGFARAAGVPAVIVGDIDRGGVIASLVGTKAVLPPEDAALIRGFIVNKFRGDPTLFDDGMARIADLTGWVNLGLVPYFAGARELPAEDSVALDVWTRAASSSGGPEGQKTVCVLKLPCISNFDDFDPLVAEPDVEVVMLEPGRAVPGHAELVVLPGSKAVISDMRALVTAGWDIDIKAHVRRGGQVLGICGGYQMLGKSISDPDGIEGPPGLISGLGLLDIETVLGAQKALQSVRGVLVNERDAAFNGYEMHVGRTSGDGLSRPFVEMADGRVDGAVSSRGLVYGCYVHGIFGADGAREALLRRLGAQTSGLNFESRIEQALDALADHLEAHIDCDALLALARAPVLEQVK